MKNKWWVVILALSLLANFALVGFVVGRMSMGAAPMPINPTIGFARLLHQLPETRREQLRPQMRTYFSTLRPGLREMRKAQRALANAIVAEPLNPSDIEDALTTLNDHLHGSQRSSHGAFVELISQLSAEERRLIVENLGRRGGRGDGRRPWMRPGPGDSSHPPD